jgi:predicted DsbA family dithiol-disulfide isomerase
VMWNGSSLAPGMRIDIIFDTICPWCFLGKRRLEQTLTSRPNVIADINWHAFLLNPDMPPDGLDREDYLIAKFGNRSRADRVCGAIAEAGQTVGIEFQFDRITRIPSSIDSHRLVQFANRRGLGSEAAEALYQAYFLEGQDTSSRLALYDIAETLGFDSNDVREYFYSDADVWEIRDQNSRAHRLGISGVPAFIIDGQFSVSGAQEPTVLGRLIDIAEERARELSAVDALPAMSD